MTEAGDPASLSAAGGLLHRLAGGLRADTTRTATGYAGLQGEWVGPASVAARRRGDLLVGAATSVAEELAAVGALLQRHSTDLAALLDEEAVIRARAGALGLAVTETGVGLATGLRGLADPAQVARTEADRRALDAAWQDLQRRLVATRAADRVALTGSTARLARAARRVRQR